MLYCSVTGPASFLDERCRQVMFDVTDVGGLGNNTMFPVQSPVMMLERPVNDNNSNRRTSDVADSREASNAGLAGLSREPRFSEPMEQSDSTVISHVPVGGVESADNRQIFESPREQNFTEQTTRQNRELMPMAIDPARAGTDLEIGSMVEVDIPGSDTHQHGVIRWMGFLNDPSKVIVGVELVRLDCYLRIDKKYLVKKCLILYIFQCNLAN